MNIAYRNLKSPADEMILSILLCHMYNHFHELSAKNGAIYYRPILNTSSLHKNDFVTLCYT